MDKPNIEIFKREGCGFCSAALRLLATANLQPIIYDVSDLEHAKEMRARVPNARTVPQIFVGGRSIGGFDELNGLFQTGKFHQMLSK